MTTEHRRNTAILIGALCLAGCGGGGGGSGSPSGVFLDSAVSGLTTTSGALVDETDAQGRFSYNSGQIVMFSIGDVVRGVHPGRDEKILTAWNGRWAYRSLDDFYANLPNRVRGVYNYGDNSFDHNRANPSGDVIVGLLSVYAQDEYRMTDRLTLTGGLRIDMQIHPDKVPVNPIDDPPSPAIDPQARVARKRSPLCIQVRLYTNTTPWTSATTVEGRTRELR